MRSRKLTKIAAVTTLLAGVSAGAVAAGSPAHASAPQVPHLYACSPGWTACTWVYYSSPFLTTVVGSQTLACDGKDYVQGEVTPWERFYTTPCG